MIPWWCGTDDARVFVVVDLLAAMTMTMTTAAGKMDAADVDPVDSSMRCQPAALARSLDPRRRHLDVRLTGVDLGAPP